MKTVETAARTSAGYDLGRQVIDLLEAHQVWATPLAFELWQQVAVAPEGPLAQEVQALVADGQPISDVVCETLADKHLPRLKLQEDVRDAGAALTGQLANVSDTMDLAKALTAAYATTLAGASDELTSDMDVAKLRGLVTTLAAATSRAHEQSSELENRLAQSTNELLQLREQFEQVRRESMLDGLTQVANRRSFDEAVTEACREADRTGANLTIALIDIDHFKRVNDTWGHQVGDQVIRYVAAELSAIPEPRFVARYGGEEFAVLFPGKSGLQAEIALERVRCDLSGRVLRRRANQEEIGQVTASARSIQALYHSKRAGRNRTTNADTVASKAA